MKRRKQMMTFRTNRSFFALSEAGRAMTSIAENTVASVVERLGTTLVRQRHGVSSDDISRQKAQDEQDMFDAQMAKTPRSSSSHQQIGWDDEPLEAGRP